MRCGKARAHSLAQWSRPASAQGARVSGGISCRFTQRSFSSSFSMLETCERDTIDRVVGVRTLNSAPTASTAHTRITYSTPYSVRHMHVQ